MMRSALPPRSPTTGLIWPSATRRRVITLERTSRDGCDEDHPRIDTTPSRIGCRVLVMVPPDTAVEVSRGGRPRDESREQAIRDAAIELLAEVGYDAMSIEAVAVRARSSKATIYRRWPGKAE